MTRDHLIRRLFSCGLSTVSIAWSFKLQVRTVERAIRQTRRRG